MSPVSPEELTLVTPYLQQKRLLQAELRRAALEQSALRGGGHMAELLSRVRVATIDGFQGGECDLVIFSAVRSNEGGNLGFLQDERRANVLLTRARRGLVVVADSSTLRQASDSV